MQKLSHSTTSQKPCLPSLEDLLTKVNEKMLPLFANESHVPSSFSNTITKYRTEAGEAHAYPVIVGGKRIRPLLVLLTAASLVGQKSMHMAEKSALAIELLHTYSLVHDDLPCMDNDNTRRGKPTTHVIYGEAKALLVGDGLLTKSFELIAQTPSVQNNQPANLCGELVATLARAAGAQGMILGQWLDISFEKIKDVTWQDIQEIHSQKTGQLLGACLELGFLCGISTEINNFLNEELFNLRKIFHQIGVTLGLVFQIIDDILDTTESSHTLGKTAGKDLDQEKATAVKLLGLEKSKQLAEELTKNCIQELEELFNQKVPEFFTKQLSGRTNDERRSCGLNSVGYMPSCQTNDEESLSFKKMLFEFIHSLTARRN